MSYILEALKKAERERNLGQVPKVTQTKQTPLFQESAAILPLQRAAGWLMGSLILIILAAAGIGTWFSQQQKIHSPAITHAATPETKAPPSVTPTPQAVTTAANPESTPAEAVTPNFKAESTPTSSTLASETTHTETPKQLNTQAAPRLAEQVTPAKPKPTPETTHVASTETTVAAPVETAVAKPKSTEKSAPVELPRVVKPTAVELPAQPAVEVLPAPLTTQNVPLLQELPASVQQRMLPLVVNVHVYAEQASQRFVLINGQRYRENMNLPKGITLLQIRPTDIVLQYQQWQFRLNPL